jgi:hypothetical protein
MISSCCAKKTIKKELSAHFRYPHELKNYKTFKKYMKKFPTQHFNFIRITIKFQLMSRKNLWAV